MTLIFQAENQFADYFCLGKRSHQFWFISTFHLYARKQLLLSAHLSHRNSVPSVTPVKNGAS